MFGPFRKSAKPVETQPSKLDEVTFEYKMALAKAEAIKQYASIDEYTWKDLRRHIENEFNRRVRKAINA